MWTVEHVVESDEAAQRAAPGACAELADVVERCCRHAARLDERLTEAGAAVVNVVAFDQVLVAFGGDAIVRAMRATAR